MAEQVERKRSGRTEDASVLGVAASMASWLGPQAEALSPGAGQAVTILIMAVVPYAAKMIRDRMGRTIGQALKGEAVKARDVLIVFVVIAGIGCAQFQGPSPPPSEQCYTAIRSYSAMIEAATAWYQDHPAGDAEKTAIRAAITGAKPFRLTCESMARQCEAWSSAHGGDPDCPQGEKMRGAAQNLSAFVDAGKGVMEVVK